MQRFLLADINCYVVFVLFIFTPEDMLLFSRFDSIQFQAAKPQVTLSDLGSQVRAGLKEAGKRLSSGLEKMEILWNIIKIPVY